MGLGDALMDAGAARVAQLRDKRRVRIMYQHRVPWSEVWDNNPRLAKTGDIGDFQLLYGRSLTTNMRPYHRDKSEKKWTYAPDFRAEVGEIYLTPNENMYALHFKPDIIVEPNIKPKASPNKAWIPEHWTEFVRLAKAAGYRLAQLGPSGVNRLPGVEWFPTPTFRAGCAILKRARAIVTTEGGLHHAAAALKVRGVVIFGGFTPVELTGYPLHRNLGVHVDGACGMRVPCPHCDAAMRAITPEQVLAELNEVMK